LRNTLKSVSARVGFDAIRMFWTHATQSMRSREMFISLLPEQGTAQADFGESLVIVGGERRKAR
jgi:hypothetical protein